jgi:hypothetical protein
MTILYVALFAIAGTGLWWLAMYGLAMFLDKGCQRAIQSGDECRIANWCE